MKDIRIDDIPRHLKERFDEENDLNAKLHQDQNLLEECYNVNIVSMDIFKDWHETGVMQAP